MSISVEHPQMAVIPGGTFTMGDSWGDGLPDEQPAYEATVKTFRLGRHAVTNRQFAAFLNDLGGVYDAGGRLLISIRPSMHSFGIEEKNGVYVCPAEFGNLPVTYVSWFGANAFCEWLTAKTGSAFRLPTENEWQYAAMGTKARKWSLGDEFDSNLYVIARSRPEPVEAGLPSEFGLFNMTGNVFEWCANEYTFRLGDGASANTLKDNRIIKGASFAFSTSQNFRNSARFACFQSSCLNCIGFRLATS